MFGVLNVLSVVIVYLRIKEIFSTFQRTETKYKVFYHLSQTAKRIMYFQTINGDCWHMMSYDTQQRKRIAALICGG